jgi:hypothetical protein
VDAGRARNGKPPVPRRRRRPLPTRCHPVNHLAIDPTAPDHRWSHRLAPEPWRHRPAVRASAQLGKPCQAAQRLLFERLSNKTRKRSGSGFSASGDHWRPLMKSIQQRDQRQRKVAHGHTGIRDPHDPHANESNRPSPVKVILPRDGASRVSESASGLLPYRARRRFLSSPRTQKLI